MPYLNDQRSVVVGGELVTYVQIFDWHVIDPGELPTSLFNMFDYTLADMIPRFCHSSHPRSSFPSNDRRQLMPSSRQLGAGSKKLRLTSLCASQVAGRVLRS
jgi:hypothetical protein